MGSAQDLDRAFGASRAQWPPSTVLYAVARSGSNRLMFEVHTRLDSGTWGLLPASPGRSVESWKMIKKGGRWSVATRKTTMNIG